MRNLGLPFALCSVLFVNPILSWAQGISCDVPLVVTRFSPETRGNELVSDLTAKDLSSRIGGSRAVVKSASVDDGGKRIAFILDASKKISKDEWTLQAQMALSFAKSAREVDRFNLSLIGVGTPVSDFMASGELQGRLKELESSRPIATEDNERLYDALMASAKHLDPPAFGDTIFLFGRPDDSGSQASLEQAEEIILRNRVRFYALSFSPAFAEKLAHLDLNKPLPKNAVPGGADDIAHATGYFFSYHQIEVLKRFPDQTPLLQGFLGELYRGIAQPYRLAINPGPTERVSLEVTIVDGKDRHINQNDVHYPHFIYPCTSN